LCPLFCRNSSGWAFHRTSGTIQREKLLEWALTWKARNLDQSPYLYIPSGKR
jgi:hypothetical protein